VCTAQPPDIVKGRTMNIRKIAVVGSFVAGAALAFAPLAAADDLTTTVDSEIASLNSIFESQAALAGDSADVTLGGTGVFDTILAADAPDAAPLTTLDYELYGPLANLLIGGLDSAPGAYDVFNGALVEFDDAGNTLASLLIGNDAIIPATDLIGLADIALDDGTIADPALFANFFNTGVGDLLAWFGGVIF
jgi:hypothetical protein